MSSCDSLVNNPFSKAFAKSTQTNKQSSLSVEEVDDHGECEVGEEDEALPNCNSDEDFVLGEIGESSNQLSEPESDSYAVI